MIIDADDDRPLIVVDAVGRLVIVVASVLRLGL
jgi:hypothetical protein